MRKYIYKIINISILIFFLSSFTEAVEMRNVTVAGFINLSDKPNNNINMVITRSLTTFLSKIPDVNVAPFSDVQRLADENKIWETPTPDPDTNKVIEMGKKLGSRFVVIGNYKIDKQNRDKIIIHAFVYNTATSELKFSQQYEGSSGIDIFDTIDNLIGDISSMLMERNIAIAKLQVNVFPDNKIYKLYVNGRFQKEISRKNGFYDSIPTGDNIEVSIRETAGLQEREVYRNIIKANEGQEFRINYSPTGSISVKSEPGIKIFINGKEAGFTDQNGILDIPNLALDTSYSIRAEKDGNPLETKEISMKDDKAYIVNFGIGKQKSLPVEASGVNYKNSILYLNILIPGFAQFQSKDYTMGSVFLAGALGGAGLFAFSEYSFSQNFNQYKNATDTTKIADLYKASENSRNLSLIGLGIWGGFTALSIVHAMVQPSLYSSIDDNDGNFTALVNGDGINISYRCGF